MKVVADRDIFRVEEYFSAYGELTFLPGREITAADVRHADALLVRTVTSVDKSLLENSTVQFVGSASSGIDHIDLDWLESKEIRFAHAPGCNADAVVNYVLAALAWLSRSAGNVDWQKLTAGIIGAGNVGARLATTLQSLGLEVSVHDPFLPESHPLSDSFETLENVLTKDIVTIHTPLTRTGNYPTHHLLNASALESMGDGSILINAARGEIVDNVALDRLLKRGKQLNVALDVWEGEPDILHSLASQVAIATPHIAGYSLNGKLNATRAICRELCRAFALSSVAFPAAMPRLPVEFTTTENEHQQLSNAVLQAYPIQEDFLFSPGRNKGEVQAERFDALRNNYRFRREFTDWGFARAAISPVLSKKLAALGFQPE